MTRRDVFLPTDTVSAFLAVRDRRLSGAPGERRVVARASALPHGTGVQLSVDDALLRTDPTQPGGLILDAADQVSGDNIRRAFQPWHVDVEPDMRHRWAAYLDPSGGATLLNLVGATTPADLEAAEAGLVEARTIELAERPVPHTFDLEHLAAIHGRLFQDVYPWAGETRTVDMHRPGGPPFITFTDIETTLVEVAQWVRDEQHFQGLGVEAFTDRAALAYHALNTTHAFREGSGRTQREWLSDLAQRAGYQFDWSLVHGRTNDRVSQMAREGDLDPLREMFRLITSSTPLPPVAAADPEATEARRITSAGRTQTTREMLTGPPTYETGTSFGRHDADPYGADRDRNR